MIKAQIDIIDSGYTQLRKTEIKIAVNDCRLHRVLVLKTGEHYDAIVTKVISGHEQGIPQIALAVTNLDNDGHSQGSPPGYFNYHDYINILAYLEEPETLQNRVGCNNNDLSTNGHMNDNYMEEMIHFRNQNPKISLLATWI